MVTSGRYQLSVNPHAVKLIILMIGVFLRLHQLATLPPDLGFDPAYYGIDALEILDGARPVYFATNFGREPLFSYLVAALFITVGVRAFAIHLTSAFIAILTLPAVYFLARELFYREEQEFLRKHGATLAMAFVAVSFWHLAWSRYSVRVILTPLLFALVLGFLMRGLRTGSRKDIWLSGAGLGVGLYTYQLAQPLIILVFAAVFFFYVNQKKRPIAQERKTFLIALMIGMAIAAPLFFYSQNNPGAFNRRLDDIVVVSTDEGIQDQLGLLFERGVAVAKVYFVEGDYDPLINVPGRPLLSPLLGVFFVLGILGACFKWRNWIYPFLLFWLVFYSLPGVFADSAAYAKRTFGTLPAVFILIAIGFGLLISAIQNIRNLAPWLIQFIWRAVATFVVLFCAGMTYYAYFEVWAANPGLESHFMEQQANIGRYMSELPDDEDIYLSPIWRENAPIIFYSDRRTDINDFNGRHCFVAPRIAKNQTTYFLAPNLAEKSTDFIATFFPTGSWNQQMDMADPSSFSVFAIPKGAAAQPQPMYAMNGNWENKVELLGYDISYDPMANSGSVTVGLYYLTTDQIRFDWIAYVHVRSEANGEIVMAGQRDRQPCFESYPTTRWKKNQIIRDEFIIPLSADAIPGTYKIYTGFYNWPSLERIQTIDSLRGSDEIQLSTINLE